MQVAICAIQELFSGKRLPIFLVDKLESFRELISTELSDCILNIYLGITQFFTPYRGFPLITFILGMLYLFFQDLKGHGFLDLCAKFIV